MTFDLSKLNLQVVQFGALKTQIFGVRPEKALIMAFGIRNAKKKSIFRAGR